MLKIIYVAILLVLGSGGIGFLIGKVLGHEQPVLALLLCIVAGGSWGLLVAKLTR